MRKKIENIIVNQCGLTNKYGYVDDVLGNVVEGIDLNLFEEDFKQGSGQELAKKFRSICSSSALAVNNFAIVKKYITEFKFLGHSDFHSGKFERQFRTNLKGTPPNLDFTIENNDTVIAFESKFLEVLSAKRVSFKDVYTKENLSYLDDFWFDLIQEYTTQLLLLDVAQLIKHCFGLINYGKANNKKVILVYIFWTPQNLHNHSIYSEHAAQLREFENKLKEQIDIEFKSMTYHEFWNLANKSKVFSDHFDNVKRRYDIDIKF